MPSTLPGEAAILVPEQFDYRRRLWNLFLNYVSNANGTYTLVSASNDLIQGNTIANASVAGIGLMARSQIRHRCNNIWARNTASFLAILVGPG